MTKPESPTAKAGPRVFYLPIYIDSRSKIPRRTLHHAIIQILRKSKCVNETHIAAFLDAIEGYIHAYRGHRSREARIKLSGTDVIRRAMHRDFLEVSKTAGRLLAQLDDICFECVGELNAAHQEATNDGANFIDEMRKDLEHLEKHSLQKHLETKLPRHRPVDKPIYDLVIAIARHFKNHFPTVPVSVAPRSRFIRVLDAIFLSCNINRSRGTDVSRLARRAIHKESI